MDFVKREDGTLIDEESYKAYLENLQKSHQIETMEYQHTPISMEQLHQAMQSTLNPNSIMHNFQLPLSPRQMSTLMLKTNLTRNFAEIPAHLPRNLDMELNHSIDSEMPQNLHHDDILNQGLNRNIDMSSGRSLGNDIDLHTALTHPMQNMSEDLRMNNENLQQNLREHDLNHEIDLSQHLNRQNLEQDILEQRRAMVIQCVPDSHLIDNNMRIDQMPQRMEQNIGRLEQNVPRLEQGDAQKLDQTGRMAQIGRIDQIGRLDAMHRLDAAQAALERFENQRLEERLVTGLNNRQMNQNIQVPMHFYIKSEQEDDSYFYENINQEMGNVEAINGHIQGEHSQPSQAAMQLETIYFSHGVPTLNSIDLYSRANYPQNYVNRENPQNLVIHRQYDNSSPYSEFKKVRENQDVIQNGAKKTQEPKENLKPSNENKIVVEYETNDETKLTEDITMIIKGQYTCYKCSEVFPSKRALKQHAKDCIQSEESSDKLGKFGCSQCAYRCQSSAILKVHERVHSGEKPFACNLCDYKSGQKNNVAKHIRVHMKEKPFHCQYCDYRCAQKNNLVVHERTHTGYKPFACPFCEYRTVQKPNLVKHMYLHTDQKPYSCDLCSYRCVQKTNLTKHKQRHLNEGDRTNKECKEQKPYRPRQKSVKCSYCRYRCVQKSSMDKHMQFKHAGLEYVDAFDGLNSVKNDENVQNLSVRKDPVTEAEESVQIPSVS